jgi:hypothetical protein
MGTCCFLFVLLGQNKGTAEAASDQDMTDKKMFHVFSGLRFWSS